MTTPRVMLDVLVALVPVMAAAVWYFGLRALLLMAVSAGAALATEWWFRRGEGTLRDYSAGVTGIIFALTLPPSLPLWMAVVGAVTAIGLGKLIWGGLGHNLFNPALIGRAFLQAAFPTALTTWSPPHAGFFELSPSTTAAPFMQSGVDIVSAATPLARMKFEGEATALDALMLGDVAGSLGETSALAILLGGLYMLVRRTFDYRIPLAIIGSVGLISGVLSLVGDYPPPGFMLLSGGLLFGAIYMATDPVTSPTAKSGLWVFGIGIGALVVLIRIWGGLPEGVMYAILLMNSAAPLIDKSMQARPFGRRRGAV